MAVFAGYPGISWDIPGYPGISRDIPDYPGISRIIPDYPGLSRDIPGYPKWGLGYPGISQKLKIFENFFSEKIFLLHFWISHLVCRSKEVLKSFQFPQNPV